MAGPSLKWLAPALTGARVRRAREQLLIHCVAIVPGRLVCGDANNASHQPQLRNVGYNLSNVILADEKFTLFHQYL